MKQMESFVAGRNCEENPLSTEFQLLMCQVQADEEDGFVPTSYTEEFLDYQWWIAGFIRTVHW